MANKNLEPLEKDIQNACCEYLARKKHFFWRQNTTPIYNRQLGMYRAMPKYSKKGIPDIILIDPIKKVMFLEVKRKSGKMSIEQISFRTRCYELGVPHHIITSVDDLINLGL